MSYFSTFNNESIFKNVSALDSKLENCSFILSIRITLFVLQSTKSTNLVSLSCKKLETSPSDSSSLAKSIPLKTSTLDSSIVSLIEIDCSEEPTLVPAFDEIWVSEKFFNPEVWTSLPTGDFISFHVWLLLTEYDRFW